MRFYCRAPFHRAQLVYYNDAPCLPKYYRVHSNQRESLRASSIAKYFFLVCLHRMRIHIRHSTNYGRLILLLYEHTCIRIRVVAKKVHSIFLDLECIQRLGLIPWYNTKHGSMELQMYVARLNCEQAAQIQSCCQLCCCHDQQCSHIHFQSRQVT